MKEECAVGTGQKSNQEALTYFKKLNDTLFMSMRYIDKNGSMIIPTDAAMPVFGGTRSHFCVNGMVLDMSFFAHYQSKLIIQLLEDHPWLVDTYLSILPETRTIVKISKVLKSKGIDKIHETCKGLRVALCGDITERIKPVLVETHGNKDLENKLDVQVLPLYYNGDSFTGISKDFSDQYLSVYRKIKTVLNQTLQKETLLGKCLITYVLETGKYFAILFLKTSQLDDVYQVAITKVKDYVVAHGFSVGFPAQVHLNADASYLKKAETEISQVFDSYGAYVLN